MALLTYKPRPKMHSWTPPAPPRPRRSPFYLLGAIVWLTAIAVGYRWLATDADTEDTALATSSPDEFRLPAVSRQPEALEPVRVEAVPASSIAGAVAPTASTEGELPPCEVFLNQTNEPLDNRLPTHLGRSSLDLFIGDNGWAKPCRTKQHRTVKLCVAIRDGAVRGLTIGTVPRNLTLENCLREQATKLAIQPEASVRVIKTTLTL